MQSSVSLYIIVYEKYVCLYINRHTDIYNIFIYSVFKGMCVCALSHVQLFVTSSTVTHQARLSTGILQATILEWVAFSSSRESFRPRDWIDISCVSCTGKQIVSPLSHLESPLREWVGNICIGWIIMIYLITKWDQRRLSPYSLSFAFILLFLHFPS